MGNSAQKENALEAKLKKVHFWTFLFWPRQTIDTKFIYNILKLYGEIFFN